MIQRYQSTCLIQNWMIFLIEWNIQRKIIVFWFWSQNILDFFPNIFLNRFAALIKMYWSCLCLDIKLMSYSFKRSQNVRKSVDMRRHPIFLIWWQNFDLWTDLWRWSKQIEGFRTKFGVWMISKNKKIRI
jgi:hypothetical protein